MKTRYTRWCAVLAAYVIMACVSCGSQDGDPAPEQPSVEQLRQTLRQTLSDQHVEALQMPAPRAPAKVELGRALFFDRELSGNRDSACVTCHRPAQAMTDGLALPVGTKAKIDPITGARTPGASLEFVARNVPDLFNRGFDQTRTMFWDRRLERIDEIDGQAVDPFFVVFDFDDGYSPENYQQIMPEGLDNTLAAQNMLPVLNRDELRGVSGDDDIHGQFNELAPITDGDFESVWAAVMKRLIAIEGYRDLFARAYPDIAPEQLTFVHAANAISAFIVQSFTLLDSPWDRFLEGDDDALTHAELRGALLFYGDKARCASCHSGALLTDQGYYNIGVPMLGNSPDPSAVYTSDRGVAHRAVAGNESRYMFRTPALRNVELTAPYLHTGVYQTLEEVIRHKSDVEEALSESALDALRASLPAEFASEMHASKDHVVLLQNIDPRIARPIHLTDGEVDDLVAFMKALTSPTARNLEHIVPESVPSGLPIQIPSPRSNDY